MDNPEQYTGAVKDNYNRQVATEDREYEYSYPVFLPSSKALDVHQAFGTGIITPKSKLLLIEKAPERRAPMTRQVKKRTQNFQVAKSVEYLDLNDYYPDEQVDYFFLDLCGNMNMKIVSSLFRNQNSFADGMRFPITLAAVDRKMRGLITDLFGEKYINKVVDKIIWSAEERIAPFCRMSSDIKKNIAVQIFLLMHSMPSKQIEITKQYVYRNTDKSRMASYMVLLDVVLHDCDEDVRRRNRLDKIVHKYNVHHSGNVWLVKEPKIGKKRVVRTVFSNAYEIGRHQGFLDNKNKPIGKWNKFSYQKIAHLVIQGNRSGLGGADVKRRIAKKFGVAV